jgi:phosphohistidine phosphatase
VNLYVIRHADALPADAPGVTDDAARPLSPEGKRQAAQLAAWLKAISVQFDQIVTSPLARALQTAEELARNLQLPAASVVKSPALAPGKATRKLAKLLLKLDGQNIALVGHEPDLSELTAWLLGSKKTQLEFAKAGVACVHCEETPQKGAGILVWLVTPEIIPPTATAK